MSAPHAASGPTDPAGPQAAFTGPQAYRGEKLGLPQDGPGSLAPTGRRLGAFLVDSIGSGLIAALFVPHHSGSGTAAQLPQLWSLVPFALDYIIGTLVAGRTLGMYLLGLRLVRVDRREAIGPGRALARTLLLAVLIPAIVFDRDNRGMHDKLTDTAVVLA